MSKILRRNSINSYSRDLLEESLKSSKFSFKMRCWGLICIRYIGLSLVIPKISKNQNLEIQITKPQNYSLQISKFFATLEIGEIVPKGFSNLLY